MSWIARTSVSDAPAVVLDNFLLQEVGNAPTSCVDAAPDLHTSGDDTDSEYADIDWCDADQLLSENASPGVPNSVEVENRAVSNENGAASNAEVSKVHVIHEKKVDDIPEKRRVVRLDLEERKRRTALRRDAAAQHHVLSLCFIARLKHLSDTCDDSLLQAIALSQIPAFVGKPSQFPKQLQSHLLARQSRKGGNDTEICHRIALLSALQGCHVLSGEQEAMLLVARCRAEATPARIVMDVPLPGAKTCLTLLSAGDMQAPQVWAEVFQKESDRWIPALADNCSLAENMHRLWVVAAGHNSQLSDVTERYCARWSATVAARGSLAKAWNDVFESYGMSDSVDACLNRLDKEHLARRSQREPLPSTLAGFRRHAGYVLASQLRQNEVIHPSTAKPVGLFRGKDPIWRRSDVMELLTQAQWRRAGRQVRDDERAHKVSRKDTIFAVSLFGFWQTEELPAPPPAADTESSTLEQCPIPGTNEYGNLEFLTKAARTNIKAHLPRGTVYIDSEVARGAAAKLQTSVPFAPAVVGFRRDGGLSKPQPIYGGVVVWAKDEAIVRACIAEREALLEMEAERLRAQRARQLFVGRKSWQRLSTSSVEVDLT